MSVAGLILVPIFWVMAFGGFGLHINEWFVALSVSAYFVAAALFFQGKRNEAKRLGT